MKRSCTGAKDRRTVPVVGFDPARPGAIRRTVRRSGMTRDLGMLSDSDGPARPKRRAGLCPATRSRPEPGGALASAVGGAGCRPSIDRVHCVSAYGVLSRCPNHHASEWAEGWGPWSNADAEGDGRQGVGVVSGGDGDADDLASGGGEFGDLLQGRVDVGSGGMVIGCTGTGAFPPTAMACSPCPTMIWRQYRRTGAGRAWGALDSRCHGLSPGRLPVMGDSMLLPKGTVHDGCCCSGLWRWEVVRAGCGLCWR
jgi:hypothetical protein